MEILIMKTTEIAQDFEKKTKYNRRIPSPNKMFLVFHKLGMGLKRQSQNAINSKYPK